MSLRRLCGAAVVAFVVSLLVVACGRAGSDTRRFPLTGTIVERGTAPSRIVVEHDAVTGLMPAMTMDVDVEGAPVMPRPGDRIAATLIVTSDRSWLQDLTVTWAASVPLAGVVAAGAARPGALAPDFQLRDQDDRPVTRHDFAGRVLVLTFIYTRCPLPDFCPLMVRHLERVRRLATEAGFGARTAFLGVTLDPAFDTPDVLRRYGAAVLKGQNLSNQWTLATGSRAQIADVATFFSVAYRAETQLVTHTLMTAVLDGGGRVVRLFPSNSWRPEELFEIVRKAIDEGATTS
jgi:protein SCO1